MVTEQCVAAMVSLLKEGGIDHVARYRDSIAVFNLVCRYIIVLTSENHAVRLGDTC